MWTMVAQQRDGPHHRTQRDAGCPGAGGNGRIRPFRTSSTCRPCASPCRHPVSSIVVAKSTYAPPRGTGTAWTGSGVSMFRYRFGGCTVPHPDHARDGGREAMEEVAPGMQSPPEVSSLERVLDDEF